MLDHSLVESDKGFFFALGEDSDGRKPLDCKLLYDSYVWRHVIEQVKPAKMSSVLELLPGSSLTIPFALEYCGFNGQLTRIDRVNRTPILSVWRFSTSFMSQDVLQSDIRGSEFQLILGNHIIDDLILRLELKSDDEYQLAYVNRSGAVGVECSRIGRQTGHSHRRGEHLPARPYTLHGTGRRAHIARIPCDGRSSCGRCSTEFVFRRLRTKRSYGMSRTPALVLLHIRGCVFPTLHGAHSFPRAFAFCEGSRTATCSHLSEPPSRQHVRHIKMSNHSSRYC